MVISAERIIFMMSKIHNDRQPPGNVARRFEPTRTCRPKSPQQITAPDDEEPLSVRAFAAFVDNYRSRQSCRCRAPSSSSAGSSRVEVSTGRCRPRRCCSCLRSTARRRMLGGWWVTAEWRSPQPLINRAAAVHQAAGVAARQRRERKPGERRAARVADELVRRRADDVG